MEWLKKSYEYSDVFAFRRRFISDNFFYYYKPYHCFKAGVIITKKEGNSCERHKIKRQVKSILVEKERAAEYKFMLIIKARNKFSIKNFNAASEEISRTLVKISKKVVV